MNPLYRPVDTSHIRREIESAQTIIELLLIVAAEKEEKPARSGNFESTFKVDGKERTVMRTPDGRFGGGSVKKAANSVGKAIGDAAGAVGKAVGDAAGSILETDQEKFQKALDVTKDFRSTVGTVDQKSDGIPPEIIAALNLMDKIGNGQIKRDSELESQIKQLEGAFTGLQVMVGLGVDTPEDFARGGNKIMNAMAELTAKSLEDNPSVADKAKKAIKGLPKQLEKANNDLKKAFAKGPMKLISEANAAFQIASEERKKQITDFQDRSLEMFSSQKKKILDELGVNTKPAREAFDTLVNVSKGVKQEVGVRVNKVKEKGKELIKNTPLKDVEAVGAVAGAVAGAVTFGGIAGAIFFPAAYAGLAAGVGVAALGGLAGLPPMTAATAALATQMCVTFAADLALLLKTDSFGKAEAVEKKVNQAIQSFYKDLQSAMEKKREEESPKTEVKEVSAAGLEYLGYLLGYE